MCQDTKSAFMLLVRYGGEKVRRSKIIKNSSSDNSDNGYVGLYSHIAFKLLEF